MIRGDTGAVGAIRPAERSAFPVERECDHSFRHAPLKQTRPVATSILQPRGVTLMH